MARRYLLDTNVLIDVLANQIPFVTDSKGIWNAHVNQEIEGFVTAISLTNFFYIARRLTTDKTEALKGVKVILDTFTICEVNAVVLRFAAQLPGNDFEDNVQLACALALNLDGIITRDQDGFKGAPLPVITPTELMAQLKQGGN